MFSPTRATPQLPSSVTLVATSAFFNDDSIRTRASSHRASKDTLKVTDRFATSVLDFLVPWK
jgi:hypothetical protein